MPTQAAQFDLIAGDTGSTLATSARSSSKGARRLPLRAIAQPLLKSASSARIAWSCLTVAGTGQQLTLANPLLGVTPTFQVQLFTSFQGKPCNVKLFNCVSTKLGFATKLEDFVIPELDFDVFANAAGNITMVLRRGVVSLKRGSRSCMLA